MSLLERYKRITSWTKRHEKYWIPLMLLGGLSADAVLYSTLDLHEKFLIQSAYVFVALAALLVIHHPAAGEKPWLQKVRVVMLFAHQFAVGGLLATSLLFYWFSGAASASWPILLIVAALMLLNEFLRTHFLRPMVQVGVLTFTLFSLASILFSFLFDSIDPVIFVAAGVASLAFMSLYVMAFARVDRLPHRRKPMLFTVVAVFALMNAAYFFNLIPPIPLSIRDAGIYHDVTRSGSDYVLTGEDETWLDKILPGQTLHVSSADSLFAFTSIFAPSDLNTSIVHKWQFHDPQKGWVTEATLSFPISGGRQEGYRGFSRKSHLTPGKWRVSVETKRGQVLGRIGFTVVAK